MKMLISLRDTNFIFFGYRPRSEMQDPRIDLLLIFEESPFFSIMAEPNYIPANGTQWFPSLHIHDSTCLFFLIAILTGIRQYLKVILICISLMISDIGHLFITIGHLFSSKKCLFRSFAHFLFGLFGFFATDWFEFLIYFGY